MPQMKPMNWLLLFLLTNIMFMFMNIMNYFFLNNFFLKKKKMNKYNNMKNWKW